MLQRLLVFLILPAIALAQGNAPDRIEWFRDLGFGMFIHSSVDSQIGAVPSHSMAGAPDDYLRRFVGDLPKTFNPRKFNPQDWAAGEVKDWKAGQTYEFRAVVTQLARHFGGGVFDENVFILKHWKR